MCLWRLYLISRSNFPDYSLPCPQNLIGGVNICKTEVTHILSTFYKRVWDRNWLWHICRWTCLVFAQWLLSWWKVVALLTTIVLNRWISSVHLTAQLSSCSPVRSSISFSSYSLSSRRCARSGSCAAGTWRCFGVGLRSKLLRYLSLVPSSSSTDTSQRWNCSTSSRRAEATRTWSFKWWPTGTRCYCTCLVCWCSGLQWSSSNCCASIRSCLCLDLRSNTPPSRYYTSPLCSFCSSLPSCSSFIWHTTRYSEPFQQSCSPLRNVCRCLSANLTSTWVHRPCWGCLVKCVS